MRIKKVFFIGALILAMGFGAMISPTVGLAEDNTTTNYQQGLGLGLGQYFAGSMRDTVASTLGITVDELYSLRSSGMSVAQIGEDKGFTTEQLLNTFVAAKTEQVEQLYKDGVITEDQKDYILDNLATRMEDRITSTQMGGGKGYGKGNRYNTDSSFVPGQGKWGRWSDSSNN